MISCPCCGQRAEHRMPCAACGSLRTMTAEAAPSLAVRPTVDEAWARVGT